MILITCDMCGNKLLKHNTVNIEIEYDGPRALVDGLCNNKRQLCMTCVTRLNNWIDDCLDKALKGGGEE